MDLVTKPKRRTKTRPVRLEAIYQFILAYKAAHDGNSPSFRQIAAGAGLHSVSYIGDYLAEMVRQGRIRMIDYKERHIEIVGARWLPPAQEEGA